MERWTFFRDPMSSGCDCGMEKDIAGDWVDYDDHVAVIAKLEAENKKLKQIAKDFYPEITKYVKAEPFDEWLKKALEE